MTSTKQYFLDGDYSKLSEDEKNGIVAVLEGWTEIQEGWCPPTCPGGQHLHPPFPCPDYLKDKALCFGLIKKYELDLVYEPKYKGTPDAWTAYNINNRKDDYDDYPSGNGAEPQLAIVHAVCEIAREQQKEKENEQSNSSNSSS